MTSGSTVRSDSCQALLVGPADSARDSLATALASDASILRVEIAGDSLEEARGRLEQISPDVVVVTGPVSGLSGPKVAQCLSSRSDSPLVVLVVSGCVSGRLDLLALSGTVALDPAVVSPVELRRVLAAWRAARVWPRAGAGSQAISRFDRSVDGKVVVFAGGKGGDGRSTAAYLCALAGSALFNNLSWALVDMDICHGDIAALADLPVETSVVDMLAAGDSIGSRQIEAARNQACKNLDVFGSPALVGAGGFGPSAVSTCLSELARNYDFVLVNSAAFVSEIEARAVAQADLMVLVVRQDVISVRAANSVVRFSESRGAVSGSMGLVVNVHDRANDLSAEDVSSALGVDLLGTIPDVGSEIQRLYSVGKLNLKGLPEAMSTRVVSLTREVAYRLGVEAVGIEGE